MATLSKEEIKKIDSLYYDPRERAEAVHSIITEAMQKHAAEHGEEHTPSQWDVLCFAIEFTAQMAIALGNETFLNHAKNGIGWLYQMHYNNASDIYGPPDREKGKEE